MTLRVGRIPLPAPELLGLLAAALVVAGSVGPWARTWGTFFVGDDIVVSYVKGINGDEGWVTLAMGIAVGVLVLLRVLRPKTSPFILTTALATAIVMLVVAGLVGVFNFSELDKIANVNRKAEYFQYGFGPSWGLVVVTVAGFIGAAALAYQMRNDHFR